MCARADELFGGDLPARLERLHLIAKRMAFRGRPGSRHSRGIGDGLEFADHRDYSLGDDPRFIDWSYYARMEKLLVRLFHTHSEAPVAVLLDVSASMAAPGARKFTYALRTAAAMTYIAMGGLEKVMLVPFSNRLLPSLETGRNRSQIPQVLEFLAGLIAGGHTDLPRCANQFVQIRPSTGTVLLISDLCDVEASLSPALGRLVGKNRDVTVIHVQESLANQPTGPVMLQHAETGMALPVTLTDEIIRSAEGFSAATRFECERACAAAGANYVAAATDMEFERLVLYCLVRAGVVGG